MSARGRRAPHWLPWLVCCVSLAMLVTGAGFRLALPDGAADDVLSVVAYTLGAALIPLVGGLLAARLPANPVGWLWCVGGLTFGIDALCDGLQRTAGEPGWLLGAARAALYVTGVCALALILLLFPTGRLPGPHWRWSGWTPVVVAGAALVVLPFAPSAVEGAPPGPWAVRGPTGEVLDAAFSTLQTALALSLLPAAASLLIRFRRAGPVERQQLKWFLYAGVFSAVTTLTSLFGVTDWRIGSWVWAIADGVSTGLLPAAVGIAVLRYRLYDIDRLISRTVSYGLLTGGLVALYFAVVTVLRPLLEPLTGSSALAVAGSTLVVAALFNPARRRLQTLVDRRFDRARYDADREVDAFAARLRDQVDLGQVVEGLRDTVSATVTPTHVGIWLRIPSGAES